MVGIEGSLNPKMQKLQGANRNLPFSPAAERSRKSELSSETPKTPDSLLRILFILSISIFSLFIINCKIAGSISPLRVPIGTPARGVKPIVVSTDLPFLTAVIEEPLPRWQVIIFKSSGFLPSIAAAL